MINIILILIAAVAVQAALSRDSGKGAATAMFFLVLLPTEVRIQMPASIPELTGHRIILLILFFNSLRLPPVANFSGQRRLIMLLSLTALCRLLSSIIAINGAESVKTVLGFLIETLFFFAVLSRYLRDRQTVEMVGWSCLAALLVIACLATVEKYRGINLAAEYIPGMVNDPKTVTATFRHRILLGYAMAMGVPLVIAFQQLIKTKRQKYIAYCGLLLLPAACYYSNSRGPWVGCALGATTIGLIGGELVRKKLKFILVLVAVVLVARPGVLDTITDLWNQTFDTSSVKGRSADYRKMLWIVAWKELSKSPERMVVGYGGHSTEMMDLAEYFEGGAGGLAGQLGYTSWDSQLACDLVQYGFLGFGIELLLYGTLFMVIFTIWRNATGPDKTVVAACVAGFITYMWALTNVAIFNPQLEFLFWGIIALGIAFHRLEVLDDADAQDDLYEFNETNAAESVAQ